MTKTLILNREQVQNFAVAYGQMICKNATDVPLNIWLVEKLSSINNIDRTYIASPIQHMEVSDLAEKIVLAFGTAAQIQKFYTINK